MKEIYVVMEFNSETNKEKIVAAFEKLESARKISETYHEVCNERLTHYVKKIKLLD